MFERLRITAAIGLMVVAVAGCSRKNPPPPADAGAADGGVPVGVPSPPLADLLSAAVAKGPPPTPPVAYPTPATVATPEVTRPDLSVLPHDDAGRPILMESGDVRMVVGPTRQDAVTAAGACMARVGACLQPGSLTAAQTVDACWASVPRCATDQPWTETGTCCPLRCAELYAALRSQGYDARVAHLRTIQSVCWNGLAQALGAS